MVMNVFLLGYLAALMPSIIALAWFVWRAYPTGERRLKYGG